MTFPVPLDDAELDVLPLKVGDVFLWRDLDGQWKTRLEIKALDYATRRKVPIESVIYEVISVRSDGLSVRVGHLPKASDPLWLALDAGDD